MAKWLHQPVLEYISNNPGVEKIEVVHHLKIVNATMETLQELEEMDKIYTQRLALPLPQGTTRCYVT